MTDYRDGDRIQTFNSGDLLPHDTYLNEQQDQIAAAFETSWVNINFSGGFSGSAYTYYPPGGLYPISCVRGLGTGGVGGDDFLKEQQGHQWLRDGCEVIGARIKVEGTGTAVATGLLFESANFSTPTGTPVTVATHDIYTGAMPGASSWAVHTVDWSSSVKSITSDTRVSLTINIPAADSGNTIILYGAQLQVQVPKA